LSHPSAAADQVLQVVSVVAAGPASEAVGVVASVVEQVVVGELLDEEEGPAALVDLQGGVQMVVHLCHPMQPTMDHLS
jgi:hypothetical protein